jgi:antitoxin CptB
LCATGCAGGGLAIAAAARYLPRVSASDPSLEHRRRRLLFRATHRGTHETDLLIGGYVARHLAAMDEAALSAMEDLLELPEPDLADWLMGREPVPEGRHAALLRAMRGAA